MRSLHTRMQKGSDSSLLILYFPTKDLGCSQNACVKTNVDKKPSPLTHWAFCILQRNPAFDLTLRCPPAIWADQCGSTQTLQGRLKVLCGPHATWSHKRTCALILTEGGCGDHSFACIGLVLTHFVMRTKLKILKQNWSSTKEGKYCPSAKRQSRNIGGKIARCPCRNCLYWIDFITLQEEEERDSWTFIHRDISREACSEGTQKNLPLAAG